MNELLNTIQILLLVTVLYFVSKKSLPNHSFSKKATKKMVLDTSALIDGRIVEVAKVGFISQQLIIPRFILNELQLLADGKDSHKRERARFGLDMVQVLQSEPDINIIIHKDDPDTHLATDDKLVMAAKRLSADLCTTDYNLNKVATIEGVRVLNVNELANSMRPVALPGERKKVKILQKGSNKKQGVGYLDDGSMVVVEDAAQYIGRVIEIEVSRYIQTEAGKMLFGKRALDKSVAPSKPKPRSNTVSN